MTSIQKQISKIPLAITMGDASGISPEIIVKTLIRNANLDTIVIGSVDAMQRAIRVVSANLQVKSIKNPKEYQGENGYIEVIEVANFVDLPNYGSVSKVSGQAAYDAITLAISLANAGEVSGIVTAPINKEALASAGIKYPGHTEILADFGGVDKVAMMLINDKIRTVLVTIHVSLKAAIQQADYAAQMSAIQFAFDGAKAFGIDNPRIAVAGLNPHAGEGGLFGKEEIEIITPAILASQKLGIDTSGPWPGDTVFMKARKGQFDVVVAQYHDQGLIPVKYMGLEKGVNITLGLPFVRTSPDHGTAFDIAGKGIADSTSLETAIDCAITLIEVKNKELNEWE